MYNNEKIYLRTKVLSGQIYKTITPHAVPTATYQSYGPCSVNASSCDEQVFPSLALAHLILFE